MQVLIELQHRTHSVRQGVSNKSIVMDQLIAKAVLVDCKQSEEDKTRSDVGI